MVIADATKNAMKNAMSNALTSATMGAMLLAQTRHLYIHTVFDRLATVGLTNGRTGGCEPPSATKR